MTLAITRLLGVACLAVWLSPPATADDHRLVLDPAATEIRFRLRATLHSVEGSATLERGTVDFDPGKGTASGEIVIEARSLATGNRKRDRVMHASVLESEAFPTIVFLPDRFEGSLGATGASPIRLHGTLRIHGAAHPMVILAEVRVDEESLAVTARFSVPYVNLGMRDPSRLLLRVAKEVEIEIRFAAPLLAPEQSWAGRSGVGGESPTVTATPPETPSPPAPGPTPRLRRARTPATAAARSSR